MPRQCIMDCSTYSKLIKFPTETSLLLKLITFPTLFHKICYVTSALVEIANTQLALCHGRMFLTRNHQPITQQQKKYKKKTNTLTLQQTSQ